MKALKILILAVFSIYWFCTIIYVLPNSYIRVKSNSLVNHMNVLVSQSWNFFAPPPDFNLRLYYRFTDQYKKPHYFEAIQNIVTEKKKMAPFNASEEFLDYVISGSASSILEQKTNFFNYYNFTIKDSSTVFYSDTSNKTVNAGYLENAAYLTLINYSKLVKEKNLSKLKIISCKFIITGIDIPKFADRNKPNTKSQEVKYFESKEF